MHEPPKVFHFDTRGFSYFLKFALVLFLFTAVGRFAAGEVGTALAQRDAGTEASEPKQTIVNEVSEHVATAVSFLGFMEKATAEESVSLSEQMAAVPAPQVGSRAYVVGDAETGEILLEKNGDAVRPIASITKLMTALVADESIGAEKTIPVSETAIATYGAQGGLKPGMSMRLSSMFYPLLLESSNDAAVAIAEYRGSAAFAELMNRKAEAVGMRDTRFAEPSGLSAENTSTARDLLLLVRHLEVEKAEIFEITTRESADGASNTGTHLYYNHHPFKKEVGFRGGKTGYTDEALKTLISTFDIEVGARTHRIAIITLGSKDTTKDTWKLLEWVREATQNALPSN